MSENYRFALETISKEGAGYVQELKKTITPEMVEKFISIGFVICGYTREAKTWRISKLGKEYIKDFCE